MAVTVQSQPAAYLPSYNNQWAVATSTQTAQPSFKYVVVLTDMLTGYSVTEKYLANPAGELQLDMSKFSELYMSNYIPVNTYGWQLNPSIRKIEYNIGEEYLVSGTLTYFVGTNYTYNVWNASLEMLTMSQYSINDYYFYLNTTMDYSYASLSDLADDTTFANRSNYLYYMIRETYQSLTSISIYAYDSTNAIISQSTIANPYSSGSTYTNNMICIDVGMKGLANISSGLVTGAYPIIPSNTAYYDVYLQPYASYDPAAFKIKRYVINCNPRFTDYTLHYLSTTGAYETLNCSLVSELNSTKTSSTFKTSPWSRSGYDMVLDYSTAVEKPQVINVQNGLRLNSNWLTPAELIKFKDLFSSPDVRLDLGTAQGYASVKVMNGSYISKNNDKLRLLTFDLQYSHNNQRQKG